MCQFVNVGFLRQPQSPCCSVPQNVDAQEPLQWPQHVHLVRLLQLVNENFSSCFVPFAVAEDNVVHVEEHNYSAVDHDAGFLGNFSKS